MGNRSSGKHSWGKYGLSELAPVPKDESPTNVTMAAAPESSRRVNAPDTPAMGDSPEIVSMFHVHLCCLPRKNVGGRVPYLSPPD